MCALCRLRLRSSLDTMPFRGSVRLSVPFEISLLPILSNELEVPFWADADGLSLVGGRRRRFLHSKVTSQSAPSLPLSLTRSLRMYCRTTQTYPGACRASDEPAVVVGVRLCCLAGEAAPDFGLERESVAYCDFSRKRGTTGISGDEAAC